MRAGRAGDRGQRRAQVVRDRAEQRVAQPLGLDPHLRPAGPRRPDAPARCASAVWSAKVSSRCSCSGASSAWLVGAAARPARPTGAARAPAGADRARRRRAAWPCRARPAGGARRPSCATPSSFGVERRTGRRATGCRDARRGAGQAARRPGCRKTSLMCRTAIVSSASTPRVLASSRLIAYSAAVRRSRCRAASACGRIRAVERADHERRPPASPAKVNRYGTSETAKVKYGRHEEEVEGGDAQDRGQQRGPAPVARGHQRRSRAGTP